MKIYWSEIFFVIGLATVIGCFVAKGEYVDACLILAWASIGFINGMNFEWKVQKRKRDKFFRNGGRSIS